MDANVLKMRSVASRKGFALARVSNCLTPSGLFSIALGVLIAAFFASVFFTPSLASADVTCESTFRRAAGPLVPLKQNTSLTIEPSRLAGVEERSRDGDRRYVKMVDFLQRLPELDHANMHDLKELSIETGRALGLSRVQVDQIILGFIESGAIGGPLHLKVLTRNVDSGNLYDGGLYLYSKDDFRKLGERIGLGLAVKTPAQREALDREVSVMVGQAKQFSPMSVQGYAAEAILAVWYKGTLEHVVAAGIKTAPTKLQWRLAKAPRKMKKMMWFGLGAGVFTSGVGHILGFGEVVTYALDAFYLGAAGTGGGELLTRSALSSWLLEFPARRLKRTQTAIQSLQQIAKAPLAIEQTTIRLEPLQPFLLKNGYSPLSIALRAETSKIQLELEVFNEINAQTQGSGAEFLVERIAPLIRLANDTADLQTRSLVQMTDAIPRVKSNLQSPVASYRAVLRATETDFDFTMTALENMKAPLASAKAFAQSAGQTTLAEQIDFLTAFINEKKPLLKADFAKRVDSAKAKLAELNRSYLQ